MIRVSLSVCTVARLPGARHHAPMQLRSGMRASSPWSEWALPVFAVVLTTTVAGAAPRVAVLVEPARPGSRRAAEGILRLVAEALEHLGAERARMLAPFDEDGLRRGRAELEAATRGIRTDPALQRAAEHERHFHRALLAFRGALGSVAVGELVETFLGLAQTRLAQDDARLARTYMASAVSLAPQIEQARFFGRPKLKALYRQVRAELSAGRVHSVRVETTPPGAEVYDGGRLVGLTPVTLEGLRAGTHLLVVRRDGFYTHGWLAEVGAEGIVALRHRLRPMPGQDRLARALQVLRHPRKWRRRPALAQAAGQDVRRLLRTDRAVVLRVTNQRKAFRLRGTVLTPEPHAVDLVLPQDATILDRVEQLVRTWAGLTE